MKLCIRGFSLVPLVEADAVASVGAAGAAGAAEVEPESGVVETAAGVAAVLVGAAGGGVGVAGAAEVVAAGAGGGVFVLVSSARSIVKMPERRTATTRLIPVKRAKPLLRYLVILAPTLTKELGRSRLL